MKKITFLFLLITASLFGQYDFEWALPTGAADSYITSNYLEIDNDLNVYKAGSFYGDIDLDPSVNENLISSPLYNYKGFIASYDSLGNFNWLIQLEQSPSAIHLKDSFIFINSSTSLLKVNKNNGSIIWTKTIDFGPNAITTDNNYNFYMAGIAASGDDLDPGVGTTIANSTSSFVMKLDSSANLIWHYTSSENIDIQKLVYDSINNVVNALGSFSGYVNLGYSKSLYKPSYGEDDLFIASFFINTGDQKWLQTIGGSENEQCEDIFINNGYTYATIRQSSDVVTFSTGEEINKLNNVQGSLIKLNQHGKLEYNVYSGAFDSPADIDSLGIIYIATTPHTGSFEVELLKINSLNGDTISNTPLFGSNSSIYFNKMRVSKNREVYLAGEFILNKGTTYDFDPTLGVSNYTSKSDYSDIFLVKLSQCAPVYSDDNKVACTDEYTWINGETYSQNTENIQHITSTESGCDSLVTLYLNFQSPPQVDLGSDTAVCENENYGVELNAGNFSSYSWLPNNETTQIISVTNAGEYSVTVTDANGCEAKDTVTFTVYNTPIVDLGSDTAVCENDNNGVEFDAGSFSSYYWTPNGETTQIINATTSGDYIVFVTDTNGCENRDTVEFTVYAIPLVDLGEDKSACENENYGVEFDAGSFNDYLWFPNSETSQIISVTTPGDYIVNVTDLNGCQASDTVSFSIDTAPTVNLGNDTTIHIGESLTLDAGTHDLYEWQDASTDQTYQIQANAVGTEYYWVKVTNQSSCSDTDTVAITIDFNVGVAEFSSSNFELFPNPTTGNLTISAKGNAEILNTRIYDLAGKEVFFSEGETNINISNLERATYIIELGTTSGTNFQKLIKK